jgi:hypothetical protein
MKTKIKQTNSELYQKTKHKLSNPSEIRDFTKRVCSICGMSATYDTKFDGSNTYTPLCDKHMIEYGDGKGYNYKQNSFIKSSKFDSKSNTGIIELFNGVTYEIIDDKIIQTTEKLNDKNNVSISPKKEIGDKTKVQKTPKVDEKTTETKILPKKEIDDKTKVIQKRLK